MLEVEQVIEQLRERTNTDLVLRAEPERGVWKLIARHDGGAELLVFPDDVLKHTPRTDWYAHLCQWVSDFVHEGQGTARTFDDIRRRLHRSGATRQKHMYATARAISELTAKNTPMMVAYTASDLAEPPAMYYLGCRIEWDGVVEPVKSNPIDKARAAIAQAREALTNP